MESKGKYEHLKKHRDELKTISCNLRDIFAWFEANKQAVVVDLYAISAAIDEVDNVICDIDGEIQLFADELDEQTTGDNKE